MPIFAKRRHAAKRFLPGFAPRVRKYSEDQERDEGGPKRTEVHVFSDAKLLYWKKVDRIARQYESDALAATRTALEIDKRELLVLLGEAHKSALRNKQSIDWRKYSEATRDYLRTQAGANWREQFLPVLEGVMTDGVNTMRDEFGFQFDVPNIGAQEWFTEYALEFASPVNGTTADLVEEVIAMGVDEGWSIDAMAGHLEEVFRQMAYGDEGGGELGRHGADVRVGRRTEGVAGPPRRTRAGGALGGQRPGGCDRRAIHRGRRGDGLSGRSCGQSRKLDQLSVHGPAGPARRGDRIVIQLIGRRAT